MRGVNEVPVKNKESKRGIGFPSVKISGIPIFRTSKGNGNWFQKSGVRNIEGGIKSHLFYGGMVL